MNSHATKIHMAPPVRSCANCTFVTVQGPELYCRRFPPAAHPVVTVGPQGDFVMLGSVSVFPKVAPDMLCGEFRVGIAKAEAADVRRYQPAANG